MLLLWIFHPLQMFPRDFYDITSPPVLNTVHFNTFSFCLFCFHFVFNLWWFGSNLLNLGINSEQKSNTRTGYLYSKISYLFSTINMCYKMNI